ncbi:peptidase M36 [Vitiosangium sp. GDMCC 1.1324]|nr:peptidase M36 [Vitiosangium sp. GDMCC 1.1324]
MSGLALVLSGTGATARTLPNYDALQDAKPAGRATAGFKLVNAKGARIAHRDERTDSPTFIWVNKNGGPAVLRTKFSRMAPEQAALAQIADQASLYGLSSFEAAGARVTSVSKNSQGVKVVTLAQESGGIEVFRQSLHLLLNRDNELVAISGTLSKHVSAELPAARMRFQLPATQAIAVAYQDLTGNMLDGSLLTQANEKQDAGSKYTHYELASYARPLAQGLIIPARVKQVFYSLPNALVPAYYVELNTGSPESRESDYYSYVVSAVDGRLLMRNNLTADVQFSYRVFADSTPPYTPHDGPSGNTATPHPTGSPTGFIPAFVPPALVTLQNAPFSKNDPWLSASATETNGNNVDAYADLTAPDGYNTGDLRPTVTAPGVFDRTMLFDIQPNANAEQIAAATTHLFYMNNWLHDWFYDFGFDEASGNAQLDNFGRGGLGNDAIRAQAQDYSGTNNANMSTPADGAPPRMQMYLFSGKRNASLTANAPGSVAGSYAVGIASGFGPQTFDTTADVVVAQDAADASGPSTTDACTALTNAADVAGKIAIVDRGTCAFTIKVANAQAAGAVGVIVADNVVAPVADIGGTDTTITIPTLRITLTDGNKLRATIPGLNVRLFRGPTLSLDGTVDNAIVAHEWGHYISNRLIQNSAGLVNNQGRSMGEGWGDFNALLMMTRAEDINVPSNANWNGVYAAAEYATRGISADSSYFGIRRVPYSTDLSKNGLMFRHITDGVALPSTPTSPGGVNSEVHNSGEIWATMLWECYVSLLRAHPFQEAQNRMKSYVVNGYKMTPTAPTFLEARDAVIAAAYANDPADGERLWAAFARRGAGVGAVAPDRYSTNHAGVVESFSVGAEVELVSAYFADDLPAGSCDKDGIFDNGETGRLRITVRNTGSKTASATSITVLSSSRGVTVGGGGFVRFPAIPVGGAAEVSVPVTLRGATTGQILTFTMALRDDEQVTAGDKIESLSFKANYDEAPGTSTTETVEANQVPWSTDYDGTLSAGYFDIVQFSSTLNRAFFGPDLGGPSDIRLTTPALSVSTTEPFIITFKHAYDFEADSGGNYDGAVIELTQDGGATWVDIGSSAYTGTLLAYTGNLNPLAGRSAFVGTTAGFPTFITTTLNLGTTYAGKSVQIRFRIGSDNGAAFTGWVLDDLSFSGITSKPFTSIVADDNVCSNRAPVANAGADVTADERARVDLAGSASDADGNTLTYSWTQVSGPAVTLSGASTLTPFFTAPNVTSDSDVVLKLTVSDGTASASDTVTVHVKNVNRAPTVNAGLDATVDERSNVTLSGSASDADGDTLSYLWTQVSGTPVALRNYNSATATFIAPEVTLDETLTFRLTVSDGSASASDTVDVVIRNVNRAPIVTASSVTVDERSTATLKAIASDADGDALTYSWTQLSGTPVTLSGANTANASFSTGEVSADSVLTFRVTVSDGKATASQDVVVTVREINRAPTVNAGLDGAVNERESFTLNGSASDADGDTLSYSWAQVSGTPVALSGATTLHATFTAPETVSGETLSFVLTVSDGKASTSDTVNVVVNPVNRAPSVTAAPVTVDERSTASLVAIASDADGDALTYSWTQVSGTPVTLDGANSATATFVAGEVSADTQLTFRVTVSDGSASASHDVVVTVRQVNRAPTANAGSASSARSGTSVSLDGTASADIDGDTLSYQWTQVGGPWVTLTGATTATPSFTAPDVTTATELVFSLSVSDGSLSSAATVHVSITPADPSSNRAPVAQARIILSGNQTSLTLDGSASSDPDGDALTYKWEQTGGPALVLGDDTHAVLSVDLPAAATYRFRLTVTDAHGATNSATVEASATPGGENHAPVAHARILFSGKQRSMTLDGSASSDMDGDALTYKWEQTRGPALVLGDDTQAVLSVDVSEAATYGFRLTVTDAHGATNSTTVEASATPGGENHAPVAQARILLSGKQTSLTLDGSASSDQDGDALTYKWEQTGGPALVLGDDTQAVLSVDVSAAATYRFRLTVTDSHGASNSTTVEATATPDNGGGGGGENHAPVAQARIILSGKQTSLTLDGSGSSDADGDALTYKWEQTGGPALTLGDATRAVLSVDVSAAATYGFRLTVTDAHGASHSTTVEATATPDNGGGGGGENHAPVAQARIILSGKQTSLTLDGSGSSDADGDALTYKWEQTGGPALALGDTTKAVLSADVSAAATYSFRLTVTDAHGASHSTTVEATATPDNGGGGGGENHAPVAKARIILSGKQTSMTLDGSGSSDADGDALTYKWEQTGGPALELGDAAQAVLSVDVSEAATYTFRLTVTDSHHASHSTVVEATATPDNGGGGGGGGGEGGGCSSTGAGAPVGMLGLALVSLLRRRRWLN